MDIAKRMNRLANVSVLPVGGLKAMEEFNKKVEAFEDSQRKAPRNLGQQSKRRKLDKSKI